MDRRLCLNCRQPAFSCFCAQLNPFDPKVEFVILIHPLEARRRIATGRMTHLMLKNSILIEGHDFTGCERVNGIVNDPARHCIILYPGHLSTDITDFTQTERAALFPPDKKLTVFVIDGTWNTARKMAHLSRCLHGVQRIAFRPSKPSRFRVRKQPNENCFSTIEAVHHAIEILGFTGGFDTRTRIHDRLLGIFDYMVEQQLELMRGKDNLRESWRSLVR